jgi:hypothetical protein
MPVSPVTRVESYEHRRTIPNSEPLPLVLEIGIREKKEFVH